MVEVRQHHVHAVGRRDRRTQAGDALGLIEPLDWAKIDPHPMFEEAKNEFGFGTNYYSTIMAWRSDAKAPSELGRVLRHGEFPGQARPAELCQLRPAVRHSRRRRAGGKAVPARSRSRLQDAEPHQGRYDLVAGRRPAAAAPEGQRGAIRDLLVGPRRRPGGHHRLLQARHARYRPGSSSPRAPIPARRRRRWAWLRDQTDAKTQACIAQYISYTGPQPRSRCICCRRTSWTSSRPTSANKKVQWLTNAQWWFENAESVAEALEGVQADAVKPDASGKVTRAGAVRPRDASSLMRATRDRAAAGCRHPRQVGDARPSSRVSCRCCFCSCSFFDLPLLDDLRLELQRSEGLRFTVPELHRSVHVDRSTCGSSGGPAWHRRRGHRCHRAARLSAGATG